MSNPRLVADINPGSGGSNPKFLTAVGGNLFFLTSSSGSVSSGYQLWKTDGITTSRVATFKNRIFFLKAVGGNILIATPSSDFNGIALLKTDGTTTSQVAVFNSDYFASSLNLNPYDPNYDLVELQAVGNTFFFPATDDNSGTELWKSDGITTSLVADINPGSLSSFPQNLTVVGGNLFFTTNSSGSISSGIPTLGWNQLWKTDGVTTSRVATFKSINSLKAVGDTLFFAASDDSSGTELWKTDGTTTSRVADIYPGSIGSDPNSLTVVGGNLFFLASSSSSTNPLTYTRTIELWKTDGITTSRVATLDYSPYTLNSYPTLTAAGGSLFFTKSPAILSAYQYSNHELWKTDGITTSRVISQSFGNSAFSVILPMWGTADGQYFFLNSSSGTSQFNPFSGYGETNFNEIWKTDGITTSLVGIFNSVSRSLIPTLIGASAASAKVGNTIFFAADDGSSGTELWALDLDNGTFFTTLEDQGNTILLRRNDGMASVQVNSDRRLVTSPFGFGAGDTSSEWQMLAAETVGGKNQILWRNNPGSFLHVWDLDANWRWQSSYGTIAFNSNDAFTLEANFQVDANRDGIIGSPFSSLESQGNTSLLRGNPDGQASVQVGSNRIAVSSPFGLGTGDASSEWQMLAAETVGTVNQILWRNNPGSFLHVWSLDANWRWQSSYGTIAFNSSEAFALEDSFQVDANRDGIIGSSFSSLESQGNTSLLRRNPDGQASVQVGSNRIAVSSPFGLGTGDASSEWQMIAAETVGTVNQILWRNNPGSFLHVWSLDANWRWQSSYGTIAFNSSEAFALEAGFQVDANLNGLIGS